MTSDDVAARHRVTAGGLGLCGVGPLIAFELGACTGVEVGAMHSRGVRGQALAGRRTTWAAITVGGLAGWRFASRWSLVLRTDVVVPLLRRGFFIGDALVGRTGVVGMRALLGIAVVIP